MVAMDELENKVLYGTIIGQVQMYEIKNSHSEPVSGGNREMWGQLGEPMLDEVDVKQEQERLEREIFDERSYSRVHCIQRFEEDVTWCIG